ncbi:MAG: hypothetical protein KGN76_00065 [Acidobacteriota bacterium]|nr:hypothetical protein [Acidobacteriota bacterium]
MDSGVFSRVGSLSRARAARVRRRLVACSLPTVVLVLMGTAGLRAAASGPTIFRLFLHDGTALVSYGEYARVGDRVVFSMPLGPLTGVPDLQLVNIPATAVDWGRTDRYADSMRYEHYVATRAASDYDALTSQVASAIEAMTKTTDPAERLKLAESIRGTVADWPRDHFGYRAANVREILELLDQTIAGFRASSGAQQFKLSLVAGIAPPPIVPPLPPPTPKDAIEQVLEVARLSDTAADRTTLYQAAIDRLSAEAASLPPAWARRTRRAVESSLSTELRWQRDYRDLARTSIEDASARAAHADVRGVEAVLDRVRRRDAQWGHRRPDAFSALLETLQDRLEAAQTLRLDRDRWELEQQALKRYRHQAGPVLEALDRATRPLEAIKALAGPDVTALDPLQRSLTVALRRLVLVEPPPELKDVQALLVSAARLGEQAAALRLRATMSGDLEAARNASSAAAGALMLRQRAQQTMEALSQPPRLR